jgi:hypothetical protein
MFFNDATFIGIDPTAGEKPFVYAALNHEFALLALGKGSIDDVLAFCAGQRYTLVGVCGPRSPNTGIMQRGDVRENLNPVPTPGRWINFRMAEYLIRQHQIHIPQTPADIDDCPNWMRMTFTLYDRLERMGYFAYPHEGAERLNIEVYPHACYTALLGVVPFKKYSLEGRIQRQLALYEKRLQVPDPMRIFEEFTRHRLLHGILPAENVYTAGELDALSAAYTAWMAAQNPDQITLIGDPDEGQIVLPVDQLKDKYTHSTENIRMSFG